MNLSRSLPVNNSSQELFVLNEGWNPKTVYFVEEKIFEDYVCTLQRCFEEYTTKCFLD